MAHRLSRGHLSIMSRLKQVQQWTHIAEKNTTHESLDNKVSIEPTTTRDAIPIHVESTFWNVPESPENSRTVRASLIGLPNAGKSSLLNSILNTSLAAVSPKVNTTRENITGVLTKDNCQIVFVDNPGIIPFQFKRTFGKNLLRTAWRGYYECDVCLLVVDVVKRPCSQLLNLIRNISPRKQPADNETEGIPVVLVLNKSDLLGRLKWAKTRLKELHIFGSFSNVVYISAKKNLGVQRLLDIIVKYSKESPWTYPPDLITPMSKLQVLEQSIRTFLYCWFNKDLPYKVGQKTIGWTKIGDTTHIEHELYTKTDLAAKIICGTGGKIVSRMQSKVEMKLSQLWNMDIKLRIYVKADKNKLPL